MIKLRILALVSTVAWASACGGSSGKTTAEGTTPEGTPVGDAIAEVTEPLDTLPEIPAAPAPMPASLLAELSIGAPNQQLNQMAAFVDAVQPGMGALATPEQFIGGLAGTVGAPNLQGVDLERPIYALVHEEQTVPSAWLLVVAVADPTLIEQSVADNPNVQALLHDGYAAIGSIEALREGAPYALSNRIKADTAPEMRVEIDVQTVLARYGDQVGMLLAQMGPAGHASAAALQQTQRLTATVNVDHLQAGVELSAQVAEGTGLSTFLGAQKPTSFAMVPHVGTGPWPIFMAGYMDVRALAPTLAQIAQADPMGAAVGEQIAAWLATLEGEVAIGASGPEGPMQIVGVYEVPDAAAARDLVDKAFATFEQQAKQLAGGELEVSFKLGAIKTRGGALHQVTYRPAKSLPKERRAELVKTMGKRGVSAYIGVVDNRLVTVYGKDAQKLARQLTRAKPSAKGKGASLQKVLDTAKERGESFVVALDLAALGGKRAAKDVAPMVIGLTFSGDQADMRLSLPVEQVKEAQGM